MSVRGQAFAMSGYPLSSSNMPGELLLRSFHWLIPLPGTSSFQYLQGEPRQVLQVIAPIRSQQDPSWWVYLKLNSIILPLTFLIPSAFWSLFFILYRLSFLNILYDLIMFIMNSLLILAPTWLDYKFYEDKYICFACLCIQAHRTVTTIQ